MSDRLPTALEVSALIRRVNGEGGFATVLAKGEPDAGAILLILMENGRDPAAYERMPSMDGTRQWHCARRADSQNSEDFDAWIARRRSQDGDLWVVELDIAGAERFIGIPPRS